MDTLFDTPLARSSDPDTSHTAANAVDGVGTLEEHLLHILTHYGPLVDDQLHATYTAQAGVKGWRKYTPQRIRTVRAGLVAQGRVEFAESKGRTATGGLSKRWRIKP